MLSFVYPDARAPECGRRELRFGDGGPASAAHAPQWSPYLLGSGYRSVDSAVAALAFFVLGATPLASCSRRSADISS
ncbi:MAG: hypothetical protein U0169_27020 [Polyangiaceae bacterium]